MSKADPRIVVKRDENEFREWLATEEGFLVTFGRMDEEPITWEPYQLAFLDCTSRFRWVNKSRQTGFSFVIAGEATARAHLRDGYAAHMVSYNREDAKEKIAYARELHAEIPLSFQKKLVRESLTELVFKSNSPGKRQSKILSHPSKAPRGKKGDVYLDELAHYAHDRDVYTGSTALIARVPGAQLTGVSTPLGSRGVFWEIAARYARRYATHWRQVVPWWLCSAFCNDQLTAMLEAPALPTRERVERFGTSALKEQFDALPLEDFQQEFECLFVDESTAYLPYSLLIQAIDPDLIVATDIGDLGTRKGAKVRIGSGRLVVGVDIGRVRDVTEIVMCEDVRGCYVPRLLLTLENTPYAEQESLLRRLLDTFQIARMSIDTTGHGAHLGENLATDYAQVEQCVFTNETKERWATNAKIRIQRRAVALPPDREFLSQCHSVRRKVLPSGKVQFEGRGTSLSGGRHHGDKFWALALAVQRDVESVIYVPTDYEVLTFS